MPPALRRPTALRAALAAAVAAPSLLACAALPAPPAVATAPVAALKVEGASGPVAGETAARQIGAEGRAALAKRHLEVMAGLDSGTLYRGNATRLLVDGPATFAAMKRSIAAARHRVLLQSYIVEDEGVAAQVGALLLERAAAGVPVALLYDAIGSIGTSSEYFDRLRAGGVAVCATNPANPIGRPGYWDLNERDHRKLLVVDDAVAYTGGINISRVYGSGSFSVRRRQGQVDPLEDGWRDTQVELRGPVAPALAAAFDATWMDQHCEGSTGMPRADAAGEPGTRHVKVLAADPDAAANPIYSHLLAAIAAARSEVLLTMAYFAPGTDVVEALAAAARRGVRVSLVLPGRSDFTLVLHAGRAHYQALLDAGVEIREMKDAMMHAKTAVIDGVWSTVGSSNLDWRSLATNHELNVVVLGDDFGQAMRALFERDREASEPVTAEAWAARGLQPRLMEWIGRLSERWL